ncbi:MAG: tRNA glutamyl-Q(34) synthetase GluQRS [Clostridiales bacterium]|nr:tRNA glutamyl-Q(34) synthetase GluQRS [Clostridiales bacterium]
MTQAKCDLNKNAVGRFAPTPSGNMHLGNVLCALLAYLSAKSKGGKFLIRIEDLDALRCPKSSAYKILDDLAVLGIISDETPLFQSERTAKYAEAEERLREKGLLYPCFCTRKELHAAHAPRLSDGGVVYGGACRNLTAAQIEEKLKTQKPCVRIQVAEKTLSFTDGLCGEISQDLLTECGDFIIKRSDGVYAYQLAVTVDDGECGVTEVVRGNDLLSSTPRQLFLFDELGFARPQYYHIPLVCDAHGRKLSKSEGDTFGDLLHRKPPEAILGALAFAAGILPENRAASLRELTERFDWALVHKDRILLPEL